jgi:hypothetical protein
VRRIPLLAVVVAVVAVGLWAVLGRTAPDAVDVSAPAAPIAPGAATAPSAPTDGEGGAPVLTDATGEWVVRTDLIPFDPNAGEGSWVGYRIDEVLASIGDFTAVGRTPQVSGSVLVEGVEVVSATITADLGGLRSDSSIRDGQIRRILADRPAVFELSGALALTGIPAAGTTELVTAPGRLRIGDVERDVEFALAVSVDGEVLVVRGSTELVLAEFDVAIPRVPSVVSVSDLVTVELQLLLTRG